MRWNRVAITAIGVALVVSEIVRSVQLLLQPKTRDESETFLPHIIRRNQDHVALESKALFRREKSHTAILATNTRLVVDILSVGSKKRPDYIQAQRETFGPHVRHYWGVAEDDDWSEPDCESSLTRQDAQAVAAYCKVARSIPIIEGSPGSLLRRQRQVYAGWDNFLARKEHPAGWLCAQRRASDNFYRLLQLYQNQSIPDYLVIMDDDTYIHLPAVMDYLSRVYNSTEPLVMVGCLIRFRHTFTIPWGGWGTILSMGSIQNLLRPIHCTSGPQDAFVDNACNRLKQDLFDEQRYFQQGMTVTDLIHAYVSTHRFVDYKNWSADTGSFCVHSDWVWGYFFNHYNIGSHTENPFHREVSEARMTSYRLSESFANPKMSTTKTRMAVAGQCRYSREKCTAESHICHYVTPEQMRNLTTIHHQELDSIPTALNKGGAVWKNNGPTHTNDTTESHSTNIPIVDVFIYPFMNHSIQHELKHYLWEGVKQSSRLRWTLNATQAPIWMVDVHRAWFRSSVYCTRFVQMAKQARLDKQSSDWKVVLLHWDDKAMDPFFDCHRATRVIDSTRIYRYKRSIVTGRRWNNATRFIEPGHVVNYGNWRDHSAAPVGHMNYGVRSDVLEGFQHLLGKDTALDLNHIVLQKKRSTDVSHFWPLLGRDDGKIVQGKASQLRNAVSETLHALAQDNTNSLEVFVGLQGQAKDTGRNQAQEAYLARLLDSKIVVVSQKDSWEDHYRLMEALVSGAMVMTDPMLTMPSGLADGKSIVVYHSLEDLVSKVQHYLDADSERQRIAQEGYKVAMSRHRSWHMIERIVRDVLQYK